MAVQERNSGIACAAMAASSSTMGVSIMALLVFGFAVIVLSAELQVG